MTKAIGSSGTEIFSGIISEDYNTLLEFPQSVDAFDEMRKGDASVKAILQAVKLPIINGTYFVTPASEDARDIEIAEFVEFALFEHLVWKNFLRHMLVAFDFGFMCFEKVYMKMDDKILFRKIAPRLPKSVQSWLTDKKDGGDADNPGIEQQILNDLRGKDSAIVKIPSAKVFRITIDQEGDNYQGISLLRSAYKHWYFKENMYKIQALGAERTGVGIPVARRTENTPIQTSEKSEVEKSLKELRANEKQYMIEPFGWEFRFETAGSAFDFDGAIRHHDRQITKSVLAQFLELGVNKGALSQGKADQELFLKAVTAHAEMILENVNRQLVRELVDFNFDGVEQYPLIEVSGIEQENIALLTDSVNKLAQKGFVTPDDQTEKALRRILDLPEMEEDVERVRNTPTEKKPEVENPEKKKREVDKDEEKEQIDKEKKKIEKSDQKKKLADDFIPFRKLTLAEEKIDVKKMRKFMDRSEAVKIALSSKTSKKLQKELKKNSEKFIEDGKFPAISPEMNTEKAELKKNLRTALNTDFEFGKTEAASELNAKGRVKTPASARAVSKVQSDAFVDKHFQDLHNEAKLVSTESLKKGASKSGVASAVGASIASTADRQIGLFSSISTNGQINSGIGTSYDQFGNLIWGYQYSSILDDRTSNVCLSLDGRVTRKRNQLPQPPVHAFCRSRIVAVRKDQEEKPNLNPPPESVMKNISPDPFKTKQPSTPTNVKDSPAKKQINKNKK